MKPMFYRLEGKEVVPSDLMEIFSIYDNEFPRKVRKTSLQLPGKSEKVTVSTVFLMVDHATIFEDRPVVFETGIFSRLHNPVIIARYCTWDDAVKGHKATLREVKRKHFNHLAIPKEE